MTFEQHELVIFTADTHCEVAGHDHSASPLPSQRMRYLAICSPCSWHGIDSENRAVEAWHDHAMPGWRDLPVQPQGFTKKALQAWLEAYPAQWQRPGAPIHTVRCQHGVRHVPGRSPWGGYDLAVIS